MSLQALFKAVIVQPIELEEAMYGNIIVPDLGSEKNKTGTVVSVGPGTGVRVVRNLDN
jgi:co-chaperonin GroES (HSP10)